MISVQKAMYRWGDTYPPVNLFSYILTAALLVLQPKCEAKQDSSERALCEADLASHILQMCPYA